MSDAFARCRSTPFTRVTTVKLVKSAGGGDELAHRAERVEPLGTGPL